MVYYLVPVTRNCSPVVNFLVLLLTAALPVWTENPTKKVRVVSDYSSEVIKSQSYEADGQLYIKNHFKREYEL